MLAFGCCLLMHVLAQTPAPQLVITCTDNIPSIPVRGLGADTGHNQL